MPHSIVHYSGVRLSDFRLDSEFWHPEFLKNSRLISSTEKIRDFVVPGISNIKKQPIQRDFEYLEISGISTNSCQYITNFVTVGDEPDRAHYILQPDDVVVSTVRPNRNAVALILDDGIVGSSGLAVLRPKGLEPAYLFAFCKTDYFVKCLMRTNKASMYPAVSVTDVLDTPIFNASPEFQAMVGSCVVAAFELQYDARDIYAAAQQVFMADLQFDENERVQRNWTIRNYSEAQEAQRMDAEYFHAKYDEIIAAIKFCTGGWDALGNLVTMQ